MYLKFEIKILAKIKEERERKEKQRRNKKTKEQERATYRYNRIKFPITYLTVLDFFVEYLEY